MSATNRPTAIAPIARNPKESGMKLLGALPMQVALVAYETPKGRRESAIAFVAPDGTAYLVPSGAASSIEWAERAVELPADLARQIVARLAAAPGAKASAVEVPAEDSVDVLGAV